MIPTDAFILGKGYKLEAAKGRRNKAGLVGVSTEASGSPLPMESRTTISPSGHNVWKYSEYCQPGKLTPVMMPKVFVFNWNIAHVAEFNLQ